MNNKKKDNQKLVLWEGAKKEIPWILFWILLLMTAYGYYQDKKICEEALLDPCSVCFGLDQGVITDDYLNNEGTVYANISINSNNIYINISINKSNIPWEDDLNSTAISDYK